MSERTGLSLEEIDALAAGTYVEVTWSGGNGPARYVVRRTEWDSVYFAMPTDGVIVGWPNESRRVVVCQ